MKKQILILTFFIAAILAGTNAYAQPTYDGVLGASLDSCLTPTTLTCFGDASALQPIAGVEYTYTITSDDYDADPDDEFVHWFVIENSDLGTVYPTGDISSALTGIDPANATLYLNSAEAGVYNVDFDDVVATVTGNTQDSIKLTWNYFDGQTKVVLLVAYVLDEAGCTDNIEVYRIFPQVSFTLDIAAINQTDNSFYVDTATTSPEECVSPIESAYYTDAAGDNVPGDGTLTVDYGENWLYFIVNAANFIDSWDPTFSFNYTGTVGDAMTADWAYYGSETSTAGADWNTINTGTGATAEVIAGGAGNSAGNGISVGTAGECIVVRVRIDHSNHENVVERSLTVTVDGNMYNVPTTDWSNNLLADFGPDGSDAGTECDQVTGDDSSTYYLTPRPDITDINPQPFELKDGRDN